MKTSVKIGVRRGGHVDSVSQRRERDLKHHPLSVSEG